MPDTRLTRPVAGGFVDYVAVTSMRRIDSQDDQLVTASAELLQLPHFLLAVDAAESREHHLSEYPRIRLERIPTGIEQDAVVTDDSARVLPYAEGMNACNVHQAASGYP